MTTNLQPLGDPRKGDELGVMGQFLKDQELVTNLNTIINSVYAAPRLFYKPVAPTAVIRGTKKYPDVSFWQGPINWDIMRSQTDAVIIREGQNEWIDERFVFNWREAGIREMLRGVYRFYDGRKSPGFQAEELVRHIENDLPEMEVIVDWERNFGGPHEGLPQVVAMMQRIEQLLPGIKLMLYTGYYWMVSNSNPIANASQYTYLKTKTKLHEAWYTDDYDIIKVAPPYPYIQLLQYGTPPEGKKYGTNSIEIDMNQTQLPDAEFYAYYGSTPPDPPDPPDPPNGGTMRTYVTGTTTADDGLRVRAQPNTSSAILGALPDNSPVEGWLENGWIEIVFNNQPGYISAQYVNYVETDPPDSSVPLPDWHVTFQAEGYPTTEITIKPTPTE